MCSVYVIQCSIVIVVLVVGTPNLDILLGKVRILFHTGTVATQVITLIVSAAEGNPRASRKDL